MLALGVVLLIFGAALAYLGRRSAAEVAWWAGLLIAAGGAILFVLAILDASGADTTAMIGAAMAGAIIPPARGNPHLSGGYDDDPSEPVAGSVTDRQPVLVAFLVGAVPLILAAATALASIFTGMPAWIVPTLTVAGTLTTGLAALWAKQRVTPTALPRLDEGTPLVPMIESERTT